MPLYPKTLTSLLPDEICAEIGISPAFRGNQIFKWISSGVMSLDNMTNVPKSVKDAVIQNGYAVYSTHVTQKLSDPDGTVKLQLSVTGIDGTTSDAAIETVLLTNKDGRKTACISTQVGCAMKCAFCKTGQLGFLRNLSAGEIAEQFYTLERETKSNLDNVVFMGMGEPLMNIANVCKAVELLSHSAGRGFSKRRFTLSTSGIVSGIRELADTAPQIRLAVSLTTADETLRKNLMPITNANPLTALKDALRYYVQKTGNRVTLEAALMAGVNTGAESAQQLISFARDIHAHINLIPWNPVEGLAFTRPSAAEVSAFAHQIENAGLPVTVRMRRGTTIQGACGQLGKTGQTPTES